MMNTEYTWGTDWLIVLEYGDTRKLERLSLYMFKNGTNVQKPTISVSGTEKELDDLYGWLLFGTGTSAVPAPGSLMYDVNKS